MPRTKGSKNKPKEVHVKLTKKSDVMPPVKIEAWKPTPDMGHIKPPEKGDALCKNCTHEGSKHYGGEKNWCNLGGCDCQAWQE